jgi:hypothetical protein
LYFYKTVPYFDVANLSQLFVRGASVKISNSTDTDSLLVDSSYNYLKCEYEFFYKGIIPIEENTSYKLSILSNGIKYTASTSTNVIPVTIDSVSYVTQFKDIYGEHEGVVPYFKDIPNQANYYRYEMNRMVDTTMKYREGKVNSPCIGGGSVPILEIGRSVYNDLNSNGDQMNLIIEPAFSHKEGLIGVVRIQNVNQVVYKFYDQLDRQKLSQLNPFVEPIFLTDGQFGKMAIGYFGCIAKSPEVAFVFPE